MIFKMAWPPYSQAEYWYNLEIHTEVYILIDLCSVEARQLESVLNFTQWQFFYLHISNMATNL